MERKPKTTFQLDSPFTATQWPQLSEDSQNTILELLYNTLSPIGRYRNDHIVPSKGKRSKKRKRQEAANLKGELHSTPESPSVPEVSRCVFVGLNSITRILELSSQKAKPRASLGPAGPEVINADSHSVHALSVDNTTLLNAPESTPQSNLQSKLIPPVQSHFAAIFVLRSSQPAILHAHLPQLMTTASLAHPGLPPTKLVQLPRGCDARLCAALGLPRVSFIGILDGAPHSRALMDFVRGTVPDIEIPWLKEVQDPQYLPVQINAIETFSSTVKKVPKES